MTEENQVEEIQVSSVSITTRSKGPTVDQILVFPKARRIKETMKEIIGTTQLQQKLNIENIKVTIPLINKQVKTVVNKPENTGKGMEEYNMGYHIVETRPMLCHFIFVRILMVNRYHPPHRSFNWIGFCFFLRLQGR